MAATYQGKTRLVLVQRADSSPVESLEQLDARRVEGVLTGHNAEEIWIALPREHWMCVGIR